MEFKDLVGKHMLSGVELSSIPNEDTWSDYSSCEVIKFTLDGVTYMAIEDPSDGYRSYCNELKITEDEPKYPFPPQEVIGEMREGDEYCKDDVIEFYDTSTNKCVLAIGTHDYDDYYPCCIMEYYPENLAINMNK